MAICWNVAHRVVAVGPRSVAAEPDPFVFDSKKTNWHIVFVAAERWIREIPAPTNTIDYGCLSTVDSRIYFIRSRTESSEHIHSSEAYP